MRAATRATPAGRAWARVRRWVGRGSTRGGPRRYLVAFLVTAVAGLVVVSVGAAILSGRIARANALAESERVATRLSQFLVEPILADALAGVPGRWEELERRMDNRLQDRSIEAIFIWTAGGEVLYSSDPAAIGAVVRPTPELDRAISGTVVADVDDRSEIPFAGESTRPLVEVYVPLEANGEHLAFETYFDTATIDQMAARLRGRILPIAIGALLALQLVQVPVAVSLARRARRQDTERAGLMARSLATSEDERSAIADGVRGGPIQELGDISQGLLGLRSSVPAERRALVDKLFAAVDSAGRSLRRLVVDLNPGPGEGGLAAAIEDLATPLREAGTDVTVRISPLPRLGADVTAAVYRTAKEALTNVTRHAGARQVWVTLERVGARRSPAVRLQVSDDGCGFSGDPHDRRREGHLGLRLVADRADDIGGVLEFGERPGGGASVTVVFPTTPRR